MKEKIDLSALFKSDEDAKKELISLKKYAKNISNYEGKILSNPEIEWVSSTISESLKYSYINNDMNELYELLVKFRASDYSSRGEIVRLIEDEVFRV